MEQLISKINSELEEAGFEFAVAQATKAEVESGAACGQLALTSEQECE